MRRTTVIEKRVSRGELPELLTAKDLEAALKISKKAVYSHASRGIIPYVRIGRSLRFPKQEILEWIEGHTYRPRFAHDKKP